MEHKKPNDFSLRSWRTAQKIIRYVGTVDGVFLLEHRRELSLKEIARGCEISVPRVKQLLARLVERRIVGRHVRTLGRSRPALTWVYHPERQIDYREPPRTPRVAAVLPAIRQALREDRESLRAVARRFGVSADTVQDERERINPYEQGTAQPWRCPKCGTWLTSPACLRCSL